VVSDIDPASSASSADIQRGDVIQEVNRKPVSSIEQYKQALAGADDKPVLLLVNRGGTTHYVDVEPAK
jgi:serine protease Do